MAGIQRLDDWFVYAPRGCSISWIVESVGAQKFEATLRVVWTSEVPEYKPIVAIGLHPTEAKNNAATAFLELYLP